jgi:hypothetical protein
LKYRTKVRTKSQSENTGFTDGLRCFEKCKVQSSLDLFNNLCFICLYQKTSGLRTAFCLSIAVAKVRLFPIQSPEKPHLQQILKTQAAINQQLA